MVYYLDLTVCFLFKQKPILDAVNEVKETMKQLKRLKNPNFISHLEELTSDPYIKLFTWVKEHMKAGESPWLFFCMLQT
jgi:hypothetical protein